MNKTMAKRSLKAEIKGMTAKSIALRSEEQKQLRHIRWIKEQEENPETIAEQELVRTDLWYQRAIMNRNEIRALLIAYACARARKWPEKNLPQTTHVWKQILARVVVLLGHHGQTHKKEARLVLKEWLQKETSSLETPTVEKKAA